MRFVLEVFIDVEEMDEATLEMYVVSQEMGGTIECTAVVAHCDETNPDICPGCGFSRPQEWCVHPAGCGYGKK